MRVLILSTVLTILTFSIVVAQETFDPLVLKDKIKIDETKVLLADVQSMAVDNRNHIFIISWQNGNLIEYSPEGKLVAVRARKGKGPGELIMPQDLNLSNSGSLLVGSLMGKITKYSSDGSSVGEFITTEDHRPLTTVAALKDGTIVAGGRNLYGNTLYLYDSTGVFKDTSFYHSNKLYQNINYQGYAGTYIAIDDQDHIYAIQSINFEVTVFNKSEKKMDQFGAPHSEFRKPVAFEKDLDNTPEGVRRLEKSFTYYTDIWTDQDKVIVQSRNDVGDEEPRFRYYVDIYDKETQEILTSEIQSEELELELVKDGKFYFLKEEINPDADRSLTRTIYVYEYKEN